MLGSRTALPLTTESIPDAALVETARLPRGYSHKTTESGQLRFSDRPGIPAKLSACGGGSRTLFRDDPEHHRSVATLVSRLCWRVFGFIT